MITEGSCDIEDWNNDTEFQLYLHIHKLHITIQIKNWFKIRIMFHNITATLFFIK